MIHIKKMFNIYLCTYVNTHKCVYNVYSYAHTKYIQYIEYIQFIV